MKRNFFDIASNRITYKKKKILIVNFIYKTCEKETFTFSKGNVKETKSKLNVK